MKESSPASTIFPMTSRVLRVDIAGGARFDFQAGQYAFLEADGHDPRAFSIASEPDENHLEFHIRNAGKGFSAHAIEKLTKGARVTVRGPYGTNVWRDDGRPLLMLAGGIGIAPMKAILQAHLHARKQSEAVLYWGARDRTQLYLDPYLREVMKNNPAFKYVPVLSDDASATDIRTGFIGQAIQADFKTLAGYSIIMAGPKPMIDATAPVLLALGAEKDHIFSDAFSV